MFQTIEIKNLKQALERPPLFPDGFKIITYDTAAFDLRQEAAQYVSDERFSTKPLPLEELHLKVPVSDQLPIDGGMNVLNRELVDTNQHFVHAYYGFVRYLAKEVLGFDVLFERSPMLRFHFPVPLPERYRSRTGNHLTHHSDTLFGDYFEQINCWLPLTTSYGSNSLQMVSFPESILVLERLAKTLAYDFDAYRDSRMKFFELLDSDLELQEGLILNTASIPIDFGELILFDARAVHGTGENVEAGTRVSIDFRLLPVDSYDTIMNTLEAEGIAPYLSEGEIAVRGDFYHEKSAFELENALPAPSKDN